MATKRWYGYCIRIAKDYPALKERHDEALRQSVTANYSAEPRGNGGVNRKTEDIALRGLTGQDAVEYDACTKAIEQTKLSRCGDAKMRMVEAVLFKQTHTIDGAALMLNYSYDTVQNWHRDFIYAIARAMGYLG